METKRKMATGTRCRLETTKCQYCIIQWCCLPRWYSPRAYGSHRRRDVRVLSIKTTGYRGRVFVLVLSALGQDDVISKRRAPWVDGARTAADVRARIGVCTQTRVQTNV